MDALYEKLADAIEKSNKAYDIPRIRAAYELAKKAHEGQMRSSGDPYISHPIEVAVILVGLGMDSDTIIGGLLHDVVEDTTVTLEDIEKQFGGDVAELVDGVTKLANIPYSSRAEQQAENVRKMLLAMAKDVRVVIIKLADRLHNMRTLDYRIPEKQRVKSLETMEIYAPLAHRLGIRSVKEELEDLSLKHLDPVAYHEIEQQLALRKEDREAFLSNIIKRIQARLEEEHVTAQIDGRVKSIYGIYRKMYIQGRSFDEIYDIYAVRIIVDTVPECYNILGIIHDMLRPIPNRFKDYISTPKQNMYQSLHTTVLDKEGVPFEVQIRTWDMHYTAEYGIAAHWKYKVGVTSEDSLEEHLAWVRKILDNQTESDATDLVRTIKTDLSSDSVFVFTPRGEVISLPAGSTVIDFAYAIHSAVGNRMIGAKVDKRIVPIDYKIKTGEIVEVITAKEGSHGPSRDWLKIVRTSEARNKIRQWFKKERREENIEEGKEELERELKRNGIIVPQDELYNLINPFVKRQNCANLEDIYAAIGYGGIQLWKIIHRIKEEYVKQKKAAEVVQKPEPPKTVEAKPNKASNGILVKGMGGDCLTKLSRCCNPLPGDDIIGFVTRGFGVSVHKRSCSNVPKDIAGSPEPERWIEVQWANQVKEEFKTTLEIVANHIPGVLMNVTQQLYNLRISVHSLNSRELKDGTDVIYATITIQGLEHLNAVISKLSNIEGIISIKRS